MFSSSVPKDIFIVSTGIVAVISQEVLRVTMIDIDVGAHIIIEQGHIMNCGHTGVVAAVLRYFPIHLECVQEVLFLSACSCVLP